MVAVLALAGNHLGEEEEEMQEGEGPEGEEEDEEKEEIKAEGQKGGRSWGEKVNERK